MLRINGALIDPIPITVEDVIDAIAQMIAEPYEAVRGIVVIDELTVVRLAHPTELAVGMVLKHRGLAVHANALDPLLRVKGQFGRRSVGTRLSPCSARHPAEHNHCKQATRHQFGHVLFLKQILDCSDDTKGWLRQAAPV
jgi:hypothetical protein